MLPTVDYLTTVCRDLIECSHHVFNCLSMNQWPHLDVILERVAYLYLIICVNKTFRQLVCD